MTTFTYMRSSHISITALKDGIAAFLGDDPIDLDEFCEAVIEMTNDRLPASFTWYPYCSEVYADTEETAKLTEADVWEIVEEAAEDLWQEWNFHRLNPRNMMDIEMIEREEAEKVANGTEYDWTDLTDWQSCHDLLYTLQHDRHADERYCREKFHEYFVECLEDMRRVDAEESDYYI